MDVKSTPVESTEVEKGYSCTDVEINCPGTKPSREYLVKPENLSPESLPIVLLVPAAGVRGSWCRSELKNEMENAKKGALCFDLKAHGMLNGQPSAITRSSNPFIYPIEKAVPVWGYTIEGMWSAIITPSKSTSFNALSIWYISA